MRASLFVHAILLGLFPVVMSKKYYMRDDVCSSPCERVYKAASSCDLADQPILPSHIAPLGFNESCLCSPDEFREYAPACIDCLFRNDVEASMRDALVRGMDGCVKIIGLPACPKKCSNIPKLMKDCDEEDAAVAAASAAAESLSSALAAASSTAVNGPLETGSAAVSAPATGETSAVKVSSLAERIKKVKEDYSKRCICKPQNIEEVEICGKCVMNYDSAAAEAIVLPARKCDPNYGVKGPLYRPTSLYKPDDDQVAAGGVSATDSPQSPKAKPNDGEQSQKKNLGTHVYADLMHIMWIVCVQILCVLSAVLYFTI
ncbi:hypothetical protein BZA77DRAFT_357235 [Pyronema omphalodes]|nr:hypothetical protein BZA77DRAFT_357235 [Pyronema omphalodes]